MNFDDQVEKSAYAANFIMQTVEQQKVLLDELRVSHPGHPIIAELEATHETTKTL